MEFVNAGLIGWAALAAIPVLVHLLHRPRPKEQPFPSLMFLKMCAKRSNAVARLKNILLMTLRVLAVAGICFAVARPRTAGAAPVGDEPPAVALVVDDSFRMGYREAGLSRFEDARRRALDVLATLPAGTECSLSLASGESTSAVPDPGVLRAELLRATTTDQAAPLSAAILSGARSLDQAKSKRHEVHIFTDLARGSWTGLGRDALKALEGVAVFVHDVGRDGSVNASVLKVELAPSTLRSGRPVEIVATLASWGRGGAVTVTLWVGESAVEEKVVSVPDGGSAIVKFRAVPDSGPLFHGRVVISTPDPLPVDNTRHFAAAVNETLKLLVVEDEPDAERGVAPFVSYALAPPTFRQKAPATVTVVSPGEFRGKDLGGFDAVMLVSPSDIGQEDLDRLANFVAAGGGLTIFADPEARAGRLAALVSSGIFPATQGCVDAASRFAPSTAEHAAFQSFRSGRNGDLTAVTFHRRLRMTTDARWRPALGFEDGLPAVLEAHLGRGRVLAFSFALASTWTDLPSFPCFVPMVHEIARHLAGSAETDRNFEAGSPVVYSLAKRPVDIEYALVNLKTGERESRRADPSVVAVSVARALSPGCYVLEMTDGKRPFSVNLDPAGSDPGRMTREEITKLLPGIQVSFTFARESTQDLRKAREGHEWTLLVLLLVVGVLLAELGLAGKS